MQQLLCHLVGDYILQNDWMALGKYRSKQIAILHGFMYSLPFLFLTQSPLALFLIGFTHAVIDHWKLAVWIDKIKNWNFKTENGFGENRPIWLTVWLGIITDNTVHLILNHLILKFINA